MFQTFSGNSRRPRQVNLSGQTINPFAPSSRTPAASGTQKTVAQAQQERLQRQQERERLSASKKIQRTWRGHKTRRDLADSRRGTWDVLDTNQDPSNTVLRLFQQLQLLVAFFSPRRKDDLGRLARLSSGISVLGYDTFLARPEIQPQLVRLAKVTLEGLQVYVNHLRQNPASFVSSCQTYTNPTRSQTGTTPCLLQLLVSIVDRRPDVIPKISHAYYTYLSQYVSNDKLSDTNRDLVLAAIRIPLVEHIELEDNGKNCDLSSCF